MGSESCSKCRYADCSPTVWPCRVCIRIHEYQDHFVPNDDTEKEQEGETK